MTANLLDWGSNLAVLHAEQPRRQASLNADTLTRDRAPYRFETGTTLCLYVLRLDDVRRISRPLYRRFRASPRALYIGGKPAPLLLDYQLWGLRKRGLPLLALLDQLWLFHPDPNFFYVRIDVGPAGFDPNNPDRPIDPLEDTDPVHLLHR